MDQIQKAILVGANLNNQHDFMNSMEELSNLAEACEIEVLGNITQKLSKVNSSYYLGKGKLQDVITLIEERTANLVIFNDELSPSQIRNLEGIFNCRVIDRTVLILDIFAQRARTREAQLQVEVAKLHYMLPRLVGLGDALSRQGGGVGINNKGSGETKLELDRRKIEDRISGLEKELISLVAQRKSQRKMRNKNEIPVIALVGYTNAGKSTIMNSMLDIFNASTEKQVFEKNMLFATLETAVRNIKLPDNKSFLLTDTVGFISKLPHHLVKAFRSTLEEITEADLLIHVVDCSNLHYKQQIDVTKETLKELGADNIPVIYAYNKLDLVEGVNSEVGDLKDGIKVDDGTTEEKQIVDIRTEDIMSEDIITDDILRNKVLTDEEAENKVLMEENVVYISAKMKIGIDQIMTLIRQKIFTQYVECEMLIPYDKGNIVSYFNNNATIKSTSYESDGIYLSLECKKADAKKYIEYVKSSAIF